MKLLTRHGADDPVALGPEGTKTARQLRADAVRVSRELAAPNDGSRVLVVVQGDRYYFAAAVLGALHRGHAVVIPPDNRRDTIMSLMQTAGTVGILHDTTVGAPIRLDHILERAPLPDPRSQGPADSHARAAGRQSPPKAQNATIIPIEEPSESRHILFEGSSNVHSPNVHSPNVHSPNVQGRHGPVLRSWQGLIDEAAVLGATVGLGDRVLVAATAPTTSAYGIVLGVLAPLLGGGAFLRTMHPDVQGLIDARRQWAQLTPAGHSALVTGPRHLQAFVAGDLHTDGLQTIVSAPPGLHPNTRRALQQQVPVPVIELVGSRGIAAAGARPLSASPGPDGDLAEFLTVQDIVLQAHPACGADATACHLGPAAHVTSDLVVDHREPDRFQLLGRADRFLTSGSTTLSLDTLEQALAGLPQVEAAAAEHVPGADGRCTRVLVAVVASTEAHAAVVEQVRARVAPLGLDHDVLPVPRLPIAKDGSCPRHDLLRLFGLGESGLPPNYRLDFGECTLDEDEPTVARLDVQVPRDCAYFEGHFSGYPILPAAAQLTAIVLPAIRMARPPLRHIQRLTRLKFLGRIRPGDRVGVELRFKSGASEVDFTLSRKGKVCSVGHVQLIEGDQA